MALKITSRDPLDNKVISLDERDQIEIGGGTERITIMVDADNNIRISADRRLIVFPRAANVIHIASVR